jgi:hypothetical protein
MLRDLAMLDKSILMLRYDPQARFGAHRHVQIWWGGLEGNGGLMLLLAFLITAHEHWRGAKVSLVTVVNSEEAQHTAEFAISGVLSSARLDAEPRVLLRQNRSIAEIMREQSQSVDLAIVGIRLPDAAAPSEPFVNRMNELLESLPTTILVHSSRNFQGEPVLFDDKAK